MFINSQNYDIPLYKIDGNVGNSSRKFHFVMVCLYFAQKEWYCSYVKNTSLAGPTVIPYKLYKNLLSRLEFELVFPKYGDDMSG